MYDPAMEITCGESKAGLDRRGCNEITVTNEGLVVIISQPAVPMATIIITRICFFPLVT